MYFGMYFTLSSSSWNFGAQQTIISRNDFVMEIGHIPGSFKFIDVDVIDDFNSLSRKLESELFKERILLSSELIITSDESVFRCTTVSEVD